MVQYNMNVFSSGKVLPVYTAANVHVAKDPCNTELPYLLWDPMYVCCALSCVSCVFIACCIFVIIFCLGSL